MLPKLHPNFLILIYFTEKTYRHTNQRIWSTLEHF